jgi:hypothetical protein
MTSTLIELCQWVRPELACLGELGRPLLDVIGAVERLGAGRDLTVLTDPGFALDLLTAAGPAGDAAVVGRVLDFLRTRADAGPVGSVTSVPAVTVAEAVERYDHGVLAMTARGTQHTYRTWIRRLVAAYGDRTPASVSAGDLTDLIAEHVLAGRQATSGAGPGEAPRRTPSPPSGTSGPTWSKRATPPTTSPTGSASPPGPSPAAGASRSRQPHCCAS